MATVFLAAAACAGAVEVPDEVALELVAGGVSRPVAVRHAGDGSGRLFVVEQDGRIVVVNNGTVNGEPFLDIVSQVESGSSEQGMLGLAFHPDHEENGFFFVNYTHDPAGSGPLSLIHI